jgi:hypothetical protein
MAVPLFIVQRDLHARALALGHHGAHGHQQGFDVGEDDGRQGGAAKMARIAFFDAWRSLHGLMLAFNDVIVQAESDCT